MTKPIQGEIRVAARVIDFLSSGLYENAAACLKELINNSYDADATTVVVSVKPDADVISIEDDGRGMSASEFERHFQNVAESHKRDAGETTDDGRPMIGKIGIGFIAANELCDEMELFSTKKGSEELLHVTIEFGEIRDRSFPERRGDDKSVLKGDYHGQILSAAAEERYTRVYLKRLRASARDQFTRSTSTTGDASVSTLYGLRPDSVRTLLAGLESWDELDVYSQTRLRVGLNVPVKYLPDWYPEEYQDTLKPLTSKVQRLNFKVLYDGTELYKPTVLTDPREKSLIRKLTYRGECISVDGYLFARHGTYKPTQVNGILTRVREAAIGEYDRDFLGYPKQLSALFQDWVTGELRVEGQLDEALNIDRRTFRETHPAYVELQQWFLKELARFLADTRQKLYTEPSKARRKERAKNAQDELRSVRAKAKRELGASAAKAIDDVFPMSASPDAGPDRRAMLRTYSVAEVYDAAIDVARAVLPPELAEEFLRELGRRLR